MTLERPEHELLRLCARRKVAPTDDAAIAALLGRGLDWPYLLRVGARQRVLPFLHECLGATAGVAVPPATLEDLGRALELMQARSRYAARELVRLHRSASDAGIPMLSFKGPVLALTLYGDVGARRFGDLDVLVPPTAVAAAEKRFADLGYARKRDYEYEIALVNPAIGIAVDLHRRLTPPNFPVAIRFARLWERRETVPLEGGCVDTLGAADLAITLCMEVVKDARVGHVTLGKVSDLACLLSRLSETDWALVASESRRVGVKQVLCFAFRLTANVLRIPAPSPAGIIPRPRRWERFLRETEEALFDVSGRRPPTKRHGDAFHFHIRERWRDRLRPYVHRARGLVAPTALDRNVLPLPQPLSLLYYLVRPVRLAHKYGTRLIRQRS
jgi:hypothetical protein